MLFGVTLLVCLFAFRLACGRCGRGLRCHGLFAFRGFAVAVLRIALLDTIAFLAGAAAAGLVGSIGLAVVVIATFFAIAAVAAHATALRTVRGAFTFLVVGILVGRAHGNKVLGCLRN